MSRPDEPDAYARLFADMDPALVSAFLRGELTISGIESVVIDLGDGVEVIEQERSARLVPPPAPTEPE